MAKKKYEIKNFAPKDIHNIIEQNKEISIDYLKLNGYLKSKCSISFKYFDKCNVCCFDKLRKEKKAKDYFKELQSFLYKIDNFDDIQKAVSHFTSKSKSKIEIKSSNGYVYQIWTTFKKHYPNDTGLFDDKEMLHIHTKGGGHGELLLYGGVVENTFYVLAFGPGHKGC